jgi:pimeloyl-ACP methyl ester carboxylesterase
MKNILQFILAISMLFGACQKSEFLTEGDYFFLENQKAKMPIWVKGNLDSETFLITAHGGPGGSGHEFPLSHGFQYLEEDYAIVYWDQRLSGLAQGDPAFEGITADIFIEDLEKVVELIRQKYNNPTLFLLGHSWGGQLAAGYLGRDNHQDLFNGWIDLDGSIYGHLEAAIMRDWILERVPERLEAEGADKEFWQYVYEWYEANPNPLNGTDDEPYLFAGALDGYAYDWERTQELNPIPYKDLIFNSMFSFAFYMSGIDDYDAWIDDLNYTPELQQITIPSLLMWGEQDGAVPVGVGEYVYEHLATPLEHKSLVVIPECSHSPHYDQPEIFYSEISHFIETYQ